MWMMRLQSNTDAGAETTDVILLTALVVFMVMMVAAFAVFTSSREDDEADRPKGTSR